MILDPVHQNIPDAPAPESPVFLGPDTQTGASNLPATPSKGTQADQIVDQYRKIGAAQNHVIGEGLPGSLPPNFNLKVPGVNAPAGAAGATGGTGISAAKPAAGYVARGASGLVRRAPAPLGASGFARRIPASAASGPQGAPRP